MLDRFLFVDWGAHVFDIDGTYVAKILKNGTRSLHAYCNEHGYKVKDVAYDIPDCRSIDVYMRNPTDRYLSGLATVKRITNHIEDLNYPCSIPGRISPRHVDFEGSGFYFDMHQYPQYWYFLQAYVDLDCTNDLMFNVYDISQLGERVVGDIHLHKMTEHPSQFQECTEEERERIETKYWIDNRIYQECMGKTVSMLDILDTLDYNKWTKELGFFNIMRKGMK